MAGVVYQQSGDGVTIGTIAATSGMLLLVSNGLDRFRKASRSRPDRR